MRIPNPAKAKPIFSAWVSTWALLVGAHSAIAHHQNPKICISKTDILSETAQTNDALIQIKLPTEGVQALPFPQRFLLRGLIDLKRETEKIIRKFGINLNLENLKIFLSPTARSNALYDRLEHQIVLTAGILRWCKTLDDYAFILAHEYTHSNPTINWATEKEISAYDEIIDGMPEGKKITDQQREEIRADLGAIKLLIQAGYNPWAGYRTIDYFDRAQEESLSYRKALIKALGSHPEDSVRKGAIKAYVAKTMAIQDLTRHTAKTLPFPKSIEEFRALTIWMQPLEQVSVFLTEIRSSLFKTNSVKSTDIEKSETSWQIYRKQEKLKSQLKSSIENRKVGLSFLLQIINIAQNFSGDAPGGSLGERYENWILMQLWSNVGWAVSQVPEILKFLSPHQKNLFLRKVEQRIALGDYSYLLGEGVLTQKSFDQITDFFIFKGLPFDTKNLDPDEYDRVLHEYLSQEKKRIVADRVFGGIDHPGCFEGDCSASHKDKSDPFFLCRKYKWKHIVEILAARALNNYLLKAPINAETLSGLSKLGSFNTYDIPDHAANYTDFTTEMIRFVYRQPKAHNLKVNLYRWLLRYHSDDPVIYRFKSPIISNEKDKLLGKLIYLDFLSWFAPKEISKQFLKMVGREFKSLEHFNQFIENHSNRNLDLKSFAPVLADWVIQDPNRIRSYRDLNMLYDETEFWGSWYTREFNSWDAPLKPLSKFIESLKARFPGSWKFDPEKSERLQRIYVRKLLEFKLYPETRDEEFKLWEKLIKRGVTIYTDNLFNKLYTTSVDPKEFQYFYERVKKGLVFEPSIRDAVLTQSLNSKNLNNMKLTGGPHNRLRKVGDVLYEIREVFPERGHAYDEIVEKVANVLEVNLKEAALIEKTKTTRVANLDKDQNFRILTGILDKALSWKLKDQWDLIQYMRGGIGPTESVQEKIGMVGAGRMRQMFLLMDPLPRVAMLDAFISSARGLVPKVELGRGYAKEILNSVLVSDDEEAKKIVFQVFEGLLYSLKATGNEPLQTLLLAHILSNPVAVEHNIAVVLRESLEILGAIGIKIGQLLAIMENIPYFIRLELRKLNDRAPAPVRFEILKEIYELLGRKEFSKYQFGPLAGSASMKYVNFATLNDKLAADQRFVFKVLREQAIAHTPMELLQLREMARYLTKINGKRYAVLNSLVKAAGEATEVETNLDHEIQMGVVADQQIYNEPNAPNRSVVTHIPKEQKMADRLIRATALNGVGFYDLSLEQQAEVAGWIVDFETNNLFREDKDFIWFDPDRHPGNYLIDLLKKKIVYVPSFEMGILDFGQTLQMSRLERDRIYTLMAHSQILKEAGPTTWSIRKISELVGLSPNQQAEFKRQLKLFFPATGEERVTCYFLLLTALDEAGKYMGRVYFDFVKAILRIQEYQHFLAKDHSIVLPETRLHQAVQQTAGPLVEEATAELSRLEKVNIYWIQKRALMRNTRAKAKPLSKSSVE